MREQGTFWCILGLSLGLGCSSAVRPVGEPFTPAVPGPNTPTITGGTTPPSAPPPAVSELDIAVARAIRRTLRHDRHLAPLARGVSVKVTKGVVTLTGTVPTQEDREAIATRISKVPCVDRVDNRLVLGG